MLLAGTLAATMGLSACGSSSASTSTAASAATESAAADSASADEAKSSAADGAESTASGELTEIDVVLDWYPNAIHTFLYEAIDKGYFEEEGLKVNLISPAESVDALTFVATNRAQIGLTYPMEIIDAASTDVSVRAIGAVTQTMLSCLTTLEGSGITEDMSTLKGKTIGYSGTAGAEAIIRTITENAGLTEDDYSLLDVGFDLTTALTTGNVDMTDGMMMNDEIVTLRNNGYDVVTYNYSDYGVPEMYDIVMVANDEAYQADPELYAGFLRACSKGFADMKASEEESLEIIMNEMNTDDNPLDETQQRENYEILLPEMETEDAAFLTMEEGRWQEIIDWMMDAGLLENEVKVEDVMTAPEF